MKIQSEYSKNRLKRVWQPERTENDNGTNLLKNFIILILTINSALIYSQNYFINFFMFNGMDQ